MTEGRNGLFLVLEGIDGAGKTTQAALLQQRLTAATGAHVIVLHEPGGTPLGEEVERLVKQADLTPEAELLLFLASRAQLVREVIKPALERGDVVLCDRFVASTRAYQGYGRGLNLNDIEGPLSLATNDLVPDLTVLLNVPVDVGLKRKQSETARREQALQFSMFDPNAYDRFHDAESGFHERVRQGYLKLAVEEKGAHWVVIDGTPAPQVVSEAIWAVVKPLVTSAPLRDSSLCSE